MALQPGDQLGPYEILSAIGAGGMGEVYKARDTRLDRFVAIKVLPDHIAHREDARARFEREARAVASLNHPNICTLFDIGPNYMVMELIEGDTLAARIAKGALPLDEAIGHAIQITDALDRAHRAGVTHRDIKPGNIMITRDGVKVLDFGLAKSAPKTPGPTEETLTNVLTTAGTVVGTPQYMAPEQFEGKEADARSDIWAFGAVLYEMVTGKRAFEGRNYTSLVAAILGADPPPMAVKPFTPVWLERLVRRCLQKDPEDRWQTMRDVVIELKSPPAEVATGPAQGPRWPWIAAAAVPTLLGAWLAFAHFGDKPASTPLLRAALVLPPNVHHDGTSIAVSPDEKRVAFSARDAEGKTLLWVRPLDSIAATPLAGTDGAGDPFWSPDGKSIGFFAESKLKRIDATGGPVLSIADVGIGGGRGGGRGASWSSAGVILFSGSNGPLKKVPASGGAVVDATKLTGQDYSHRRPWILPDGRHFVFLAGAGNSAAPKTIRLGSLDTAESTKLIDAADSVAIYSAGHLLYLRGEVLMAQPFDARKPAITGDAVPVVEGIPGGGVPTLGGFSASPNGLLVHASGSTQLSDLTWFDRKGDRIATLGEPASFRSLDFSADRSQVAVTILDQRRNQDVWLVDPARGFRTPMSAGRRISDVALSADGRLVFYSVGLQARTQIFRRRADAAGSDEMVWESPSDQVSEVDFDVSPDGKFLLRGSRDGLWVLPDPVGEPGKLKPYRFPYGSSGAMQPEFSPDGRWIAFASTQTGRSEIFVTAFPGPGVQRQISAAGGSQPRWRGDGREIFFVARDGRIAAAEVSARNMTLEPGEVRSLFNPRMPTSARVAPYDVSADGQRILAITLRDASEGLKVVQNWPALLKK